MDLHRHRVVVVPDRPFPADEFVVAGDVGHLASIGRSEKGGATSRTGFGVVRPDRRRVRIVRAEARALRSPPAMPDAGGEHGPTCSLVVTTPAASVWWALSAETRTAHPDGTRRAVEAFRWLDGGSQSGQ